MLIKIPTDKTVSETAAALQIAVEANHFGVMQVHNLNESMAKKGVEFAHECLIFEVCQPKQAKGDWNDLLLTKDSVCSQCWMKNLQKRDRR